MSEVPALKIASTEIRKPVPGPKKGSRKTIMPDPPAVDPFISEKPATKTFAPGTDAISFSTPSEPNIFKSSDYYFNRAIFYQQSRNLGKALRNYSKNTEIDANNLNIYNNIGVTYKELRQYDQAIEEFIRAIYLNLDYVKPIIILAWYTMPKKISKEPFETIKKPSQLVQKTWRH